MTTTVEWTVEEWPLLQAWCFLNDTTPEEFCASIVSDALIVARDDPDVVALLQLRDRARKGAG